MKPIYEPKGPAKEYGDLAINIYTGCPHRCSYCYVPNVLKIDRDEFHKNISVRKDVVNAVREQLQREKISDKLIHLCFTCDPYPTGYDSQATRDIISLI
jgi:DNA repair photolyase